MKRYDRERSEKWQNRYSEEFKRHVCNDLVTSGLTRREIERKYKLGNCRVDAWMKQLGYSFKKAEIVVNMLNDPPKDQSEDKVSVEALKRELEDARLQAEAYRRMIEKAEEEFNINIRKKSDTK